MSESEGALTNHAEPVGQGITPDQHPLYALYQTPEFQQKWAEQGWIEALEAYRRLAQSEAREAALRAQIAQLEAK